MNPIVFMRCSLLVCLLAATQTVLGQSLRDSTTQADYVIVCSSEFRTQAERLARFRQEYNNFTTRVAIVDSIYACFPSSAPDSSLRQFIRFAAQSWSFPRPRYFLLAGNINTVPSHLEPDPLVPANTIPVLLCMDNWFVETTQAPSEIPGTLAAIGRLSAWTPEQLDAVISKIIAYEESEPESWMRRSLMLADYWEPDGDAFEQTANDIQQAFDKIWSDKTIIHIHESSPLHRDVSGFLSEWQKGAAFVTYAGHGNARIWSHSIYLTTDDVERLDNGARLPVCLLITSDQTFDDPDSASIVERLLLQPGGGAVAIVAFPGSWYRSVGESFYRNVVDLFCADPSLSLGQAIVRVRNGEKSTISAPFLRGINILGDPAIIPKRMTDLAGITGTPNPTAGFTLAQNYPNPFNASTQISFTLPEPGKVTVIVYNILGEMVTKVYDGYCESGTHTIEFSAVNLSSRVYIVRLTFGNRSAVRTTVLLK